MEFNLDGAANYIYYSGPDAEGVTGSFVLDVENQTLEVDGAICLERPTIGKVLTEFTRLFHSQKVN